MKAPLLTISRPSFFSAERFTFSAAGSQQGTAAITSYQWQTGDGNGTEPILENEFTTAYWQPGTFYPAVTVTDASGLSDSASAAITISANLAQGYALGDALTFLEQVVATELPEFAQIDYKGELPLEKHHVATTSDFDANGNPVSGQNVQFVATGSNNTLTQPAAVTNAAGQATSGSIIMISPMPSPLMSPAAAPRQTKPPFSGVP